MRTALAAFWLSAAAITPGAARAQAFFPQAELDYWNEARAKRTAEAAEASERPARPQDASPFRWQDYEDPTTDAFWDDGGNYVPPRALRVVAADPTPENVARYLGWQRRKLQVIGALNEEIARQTPRPPAAPGVPPVAGAIPPAGKLPVAADEAELVRQSGPPIDWKGVDVVFFYSSQCPHCQASLATVQELEQLGARVIPVQTDWRERPPLLPGSVPYDGAIAREQPIDAVPTWIAAYQGDRLTMQGHVTVQSIELTLKLAQQQQSPQEQEQHPTNHQDGG